MPTLEPDQKKLQPSERARKLETLMMADSICQITDTVVFYQKKYWYNKIQLLEHFSRSLDNVPQFVCP